MDISFASISDLTQALKSKKVSAVEVTKHFQQRIEKLNPQLNAYVTLDETAVKQAEAVDQKISRGETNGALLGVPVGIKDLICTRGVRTTAASKILENFVPPYDATLFARLKRAGAIHLGKLNLDEFAMGSSNETSVFGPSRNPWDLARTPGGSSGGSAAAQASRLAALTIGTDTGGSIRQPANFCGVVGVKPTYGRISRYGVVAYASSLDQAGPLASSVADAAISLEVLCGHDPMDSTTSKKDVPTFSKDLTANIKGMKIGVIKEFSTNGLSEATSKALQKALEVLKYQGAEVKEFSIPLTEVSIPVYYLIASSEASSNLSRYDGVKFGYRAPMGKLSSMSLDEFYSSTRGQGFGSEVKRRIMLGTYCLSSGYFDAFYSKACQVRRLLQGQFAEAFKSCDVLISPVTTAPAFKIGERISDPLSMYLNDIFTVSTNLVGLPGMSLPFSLSEDGLPVGIQLQASAFEEQKMLNVAFALEQAAGMQGKRPHVV